MGRKKTYLCRFVGAIFAIAFVFSFSSTIATFAAGNIFKVQDVGLMDLSSNTEGNIVRFEEEKIISDIVFHYLDDSATYKITLKNTDSKEHIIETISDNNENEYISYIYDKHENETIDAGGSFDLIVTVKYETAVANLEERIQATNVKFIINYLNEEEPDIIPLVPNTGENSGIGDSVKVSIVSLIISATGLIVGGIIILKKSKKHIKLMSGIIVAVAAMAVSATSYAVITETNSFTIDAKYGLYDKLLVTYGDQNIIVNYGEKVTIDDPEKPGYDFIAWEDENGVQIDLNNPILKDTSLRPIWNRHSYTIKFDKNQGSGEMSDLRVFYDVAKNLTANAFVRTGYEFLGWNTVADGSGISYADGAEINNLTADDNVVITLFAQWQANQYKIVFRANEEGVSGNMPSNLPMIYDQEQQLPVNTLEKTGLIFDSWNTKADGTGDRYEDGATVINLATSGTVILYAQWAVTPYVVVYDKNAENAEGTMENQEIEYGVSANLYALQFSRTGYDFSGWNTKSDGSGDWYTDGATVKNLDVDGEVILYAQWTPKQYAISFDKNSTEATGAMDDQLVVYDTQTILRANEFIRTGFVTAGWNTKSDGTGTHYDENQDITNVLYENDITLYVEWAVTPYEIIFDKNNENVTGAMENMSVPYGVAVNLTPLGFDYDEYNCRFLGWNTKADGTGTSYSDGATVKNLDTDGEAVLYAQWEKKIAIFKTLGTPRNASTSIFKHYEGTPSAEVLNSAIRLETSNSNTPIYGWESGTNFYWWSETNAKLPADCSRFFERNSAYTEIYMAGIDSSEVENATAMFHNNQRLKKIDLTGFNTDSLTNMMAMFEANYVLEQVIFPEGFGKNVTNASRLFYDARKLKTIDFSNFDSSNLQKIASMFEKNGSLETVILPENFGAKVTDARYVFADSSLKNFNAGNFNTGSLVNVSQMFKNAKISTLNLNGWDTSKVENMSSMFEGSTVTSLDIHSWNTSNVTNMSKMFSNCANLTNISVAEWNVEKVETMEDMFYKDSELVKLDLSGWKPTSLKNMYRMIGWAHKITEIDMSSFVTNNVEKMTWVFADDRELKTIYSNADWDISSVTDNRGASMFDMAKKLTGGAGTATILAGVTEDRQQAMLNGTYALIDDPDNGRPGYLTKKGARYIQYKGNGATGGTMTSHYLTNTGSLKQNAFTREEYVFTGWNTAADGSGTAYEDEALMEDLTESKTPLTLYAQWKIIDAAVKNAGGGEPFNSILKGVITDNPGVNTFKKYGLGTPDDATLESAMNISATNTPLYLWVDDENIYWWSEDPKPRLAAAKSIQYLFKEIGTTDAPFELVDLTGFDTSNVEDASCLFQNAKIKKVNISDWDLSNATALNSFLSGDTVLEEVLFPAVFDLQKVTNMSGVFSNTSSASLDLSGWKTRDVTTMSGMFYKTKAQSITFSDNFDTSKVTDMSTMFSQIAATELDLSVFNTAKVKNMNSMFEYSEHLVNLDLTSFSSAAATTMEYMFRRDYALTTVAFGDNFAAEKVTNIHSAFENCTALKTIYVSTNFAPGSSIDARDVFKGATKLVGGAGTTWSSSAYSGIGRLKIDGGADDPGYLTDLADRS